LLPLTLAQSEQNSKVNVTDRDRDSNTTVPAQLPLPLPLGSNHSDLPNAEKLTRYRRHPPHGSKRSKQRRRRVKSPVPKIKYGPPSYPSAPVSSYYKPASPSSSSYPSHHMEPSFSIEDFQHLKFDGTDFHIPASSYEAQSMDLNLYSHEDNDLYGAHKFPSLEYSFPEHESPPVSSYEHTPHQKYGVPPLHQSFEPSSYETPESYVSNHYAPPPAPPASSASPSTHYGVPSAPAHVPSYTHPGPPPAPDSYSIYEQKIPNAGYHQNFAEPPRAPPAGHSSNYEISYSPPAYEISTSYQDSEPQYEHNYEPPASAHDGHFAEPPPPAPPQHPSSYHPPPHAPSYSPPAPPQHPPSYSPPHPPQHSPPYSPPHPPQHAPSHPSQHAPPHAPPHPSQHPPSNYAQPEAQPPSSYTNVELHPKPNPAQHYPNENYALPSEELPLSPNHKFPSFDFPKSSYEVPIYDPIPFEASNKEEQESYPPILPDSSSNDLPSDAHASGSSQSPTTRRKRKRRPSTALISKKHTLDVPELQEAYDADSHVHVRGTDLDTAAHGSRYVEQKRNYVTSTASTSTVTTPAPWSPMRFRTTSSGGFIPTIITSTPPSQTTSRSRSRGTSRFRSRPTTEASSTAVTIQKSRSQSYYDGTIAPPHYQQFPGQTGRGTRPTRPGQGRGGGAPPGGITLALQPGTERNPTLKRTTKGVFDTTLFKSPQSDRELEHKLHMLRQNLPKNHKLY
ncbi:early nodulin-75, partial [Drosophila innubila]|uniref:early nodulin-75 n=1 Tax=Drosophila innubila TaxID=198719 RepID=UPI00148C476B